MGADERSAGSTTPASADSSLASERQAMRLIEALASEVGPRRPTTRAERLAAELLRAELARGGLGARIERFEGYATFGLPYGTILATALAPALLPRRLAAMRSALALLAAGALISEGDLRFTPLSRALSRKSSQNVVATIEPAGRPRRTLCLCAHLDSSRSGLIFDPRFVGQLGRVITAQSLAVLVGALEPAIGRRPAGQVALALARGAVAAGLALTVERELRGEDVPGANDNASGVAVVTALAHELAAQPPATTRLVVLLTGCEESGTLGMQRFLDRHDTDGWLFLNVDNVAGGGSVRYLRREGLIAKWRADPGLVAAAERVAARRPDLRLAPEDAPAGLTYDSSPVLARGGRALTLSVQDGAIPNLHWPTDTFENVDSDGVARTLAAARELVAAADAGAAD